MCSDQAPAVEWISADSLLLLSFIIHAGNKKQTNLPEKFKVYRGLKLPQSELEEKYQVGKTINLTGFTSSTLSKETALSFAFDGKTILKEDTNRLPLLVEIEYTGDKEFIQLNSEELSAYPSEQEVLLQDGIQYKVVSVTK